MIALVYVVAILFGFSAFCFVVAYQNGGALDDAGQPRASGQPASSSSTVLPSEACAVLLEHAKTNGPSAHLAGSAPGPPTTTEG